MPIKITKDFHEETVVGGYARVKPAAVASLVVSLTDSKHKSLRKGYGVYRIDPRKPDWCYFGGCLGTVFQSRFEATPEGEEFRWSNMRFRRLTAEEVANIMNAGPYITAISKF